MEPLLTVAPEERPIVHDRKALGIHDQFVQNNKTTLQLRPLNSVPWPDFVPQNVSIIIIKELLL